jgi:hypothetical protein
VRFEEAKFFVVKNVMCVVGVNIFLDGLVHLQ